MAVTLGVAYADAMRRQRILVLAAAMIAIAAAARHPTADIEILTHRIDDPSPHRVEAAVDLGVIAVKVLLTWTAGRVVS